MREWGRARESVSESKKRADDRETNNYSKDYVLKFVVSKLHQLKSKGHKMLIVRNVAISIGVV